MSSVNNNGTIVSTFITQPLILSKLLVDGNNSGTIVSTFITHPDDDDDGLMMMRDLTWEMLTLSLIETVNLFCGS